MGDIPSINSFTFAALMEGSTTFCEKKEGREEGREEAATDERERRESRHWSRRIWANFNSGQAAFLSPSLFDSLILWLE